MKNILRILICILITDFSLSATNKFSRKQIVEDVMYMDSIIKAVHPDPFCRISKNEYENVKNDIMLNLIDSCSMDEAYLKLAPLISSLKDGHTMMLMPYNILIERLKLGNKIFPIVIQVERNKIIAKYDCNNQYYFPDETEIIAINGIHTNILLNEFLKLYPIEKYPDLFYDTIENDFYALLMYNNVCKGDEAEIEVVLKKGGHVLRYITQLVSYQIYQSYVDSIQDKIYNYAIRNDTAYLKVGSFMPTEEYYKFIESSFENIDSLEIDNLVIDIQNNRGGSSKAVDDLITYLYPDSFSLYSLIELKNNPKNKSQTSYRNKYLKDEYTEAGECLFFVPNKKISHKSNIYKGMLIVRIDESTYSGAESFANFIFTSKRGKIVGNRIISKTSFGNFTTFKLPNTELNFTVSTTKFVNY